MNNNEKKAGNFEFYIEYVIEKYGQNLLSLIAYCIFCFSFILLSINNANAKSIIVGAEQFSQYLPQLSGKRVGLVVNQTSVVNEQHLVDVLLAKGVNIKAVFAPEHGFRGNLDAGQTFKNATDSKTQLPIISIYGKYKKPTPEVLASLDVIIFDIQDVGVRYYTYISSMHYMMEAAADANIHFIVLDRPNPNGAYVDGPILEPEFRSFVGMHNIPLLHGMTVGELAQMFVGEQWLNAQNTLSLQVVKVLNYKKSDSYHLPIKPSPNLPNQQAIALYPSLGFFEATPVSIGRGTPFPFQVIGHNTIHLGDFNFTPKSTPGAALKPKLMDKQLKGQDLRNESAGGLDLSYIIQWHQAFKQQQLIFFNRADFMDKLSGTDKLRQAIVSGKTEQQIKASWQAPLQQFKAQRKPYLLYH